MSHMLSEPGFWELEADDYHQDPAPAPSLSQSIGKDLLEFCPRVAWWKHPRLNPQFVPEDETKFDLGTVSHRLFLGKGKPFRAVDAPSWQGKQAQMLRDAYRQAGFVPILVHQHDNCMAMLDALRKQLPSIEGGEFAFNPQFGDIELCALSLDPVGCWGRSLIDFYGGKVPTGVVCWDYKTTSGSANPAGLRTQFNRLGWAFQAAFQERLITTLKPALAGKIAFKFLVQGNEEPYLCSVVEPDAEARTIAHKQVAAAFAIWKACLGGTLYRGAWPAYPRHSVPLGITQNAEAAWLARELDDEMVQLAANDPYLSGGLAADTTRDLSSSSVNHNAAQHFRAHNEFLKGLAAQPARKKRGPYKPRKPKEPVALPPDQTVLDAG